MDSLRSFSTGIIGDGEEMEKLYLGIGLTETLGGMASSVMWTGLFSQVVGKGWWVERLPFWGVLVCMIAVGWAVVRLGRFIGGSGVV